jgi:2-phosphosulfolactate phosphatase
VVPLADPEEALRRAREKAEDHVLTGGERGGRKIEGFDLGNSPLEYGKSVVKNRTIFFSSTNGSQAVVKAREAGAEGLCLAAMLNAKAAAIRILRKNRDAVLVCSGDEGGFSLEDALCAGLIVQRLIAIAGPEAVVATDSAQACRTLYEQAEHDLLRRVMESSHGRDLVRLGLADDIPFAVRPDVSRVVPVYKNGVFVPEIVI